MRFRLLFKPLMYTLWRFGWVDELLEIENTQHAIIIEPPLTLQLNSATFLSSNDCRKEK